MIVTKEMVDAGRKALDKMDSGLWTRGGDSYTDLLGAIYNAMLAASRPPK